MSYVPRLFEHTNSAQSSVVCAPVFVTGLISYKLTLNPCFASCNGASDPASPAPIIFTSISVVYLRYKRVSNSDYVFMLQNCYDCSKNY